MLSYTIYLLILFFGQWKEAGFVSVIPESQRDLVELLCAKRKIVSQRVSSVMMQVDRWHYTEHFPYADEPRPNSFGLNMSAPSVHAKVLEILKDHLTEGNIALDVGSGSGYLTACMGVMVGKTGHVVGIEIIEGLVHNSNIHIINSNPPLIIKKRVTLVDGDGRKGYPEKAPYDVIHVGAAATKVPKALLEQLKVGGRMLIAIGKPNQKQKLKIIDKISKETTEEEDAGTVMYPPLTGEHRKLKTTTPSE